jgi:hypothetical protein
VSAGLRVAVRGRVAIRGNTGGHRSGLLGERLIARRGALLSVERSNVCAEREASISPAGTVPLFVRVRDRSAFVTPAYVVIDHGVQGVVKLSSLEK